MAVAVVAVGTVLPVVVEGVSAAVFKASVVAGSCVAEITVDLTLTASVVDFAGVKEIDLSDVASVVIGLAIVTAVLPVTFVDMAELDVDEIVDEAYVPVFSVTAVVRGLVVVIVGVLVVNTGVRVVVAVVAAAVCDVDLEVITALTVLVAAIRVGLALLVSALTVDGVFTVVIKGVTADIVLVSSVVAEVAGALPSTVENFVEVAIPGLSDVADVCIRVDLVESVPRLSARTID